MSHESPSINSMRILRAYRLNNVENAKLKNQLFVMDKSKRREMRLANQDIRLINLTLEYISSSSGHSPEGLHPDYVDRTKREESTPMFMYGERIVSRKFRRVQSAHAGLGRKANGGRGGDEEDSANQETAGEGLELPSSTKPVVAAEKKGKSQRPKSSPAKALTFTGLRRAKSFRQQKFDKSGSGDGAVSEKQGGGSSRRGGGVRKSSVLKYQVEEDTAEAEEPLTAVAIETAREDSAQNGEDKRNAGGSGNQSGGTTGNELKQFSSSESKSRVGGGSGINHSLPAPQNGVAREEAKVNPIYLTDTGDDGNTSKYPTEGMTDSVYTPIIRRPKSRPRSQNEDRQQEMTRKVKEAREQVLTARKSKPDPTQAWALPASNPLKQQAMIDFKKNMNLDKNQVIKDRLKDFMQAYPVRKY